MDDEIKFCQIVTRFSPNMPIFQLTSKLENICLQNKSPPLRQTLFQFKNTKPENCTGTHQVRTACGTGTPQEHQFAICSTSIQLSVCEMAQVLGPCTHVEDLAEGSQLPQLWASQPFGLEILFCHPSTSKFNKEQVAEFKPNLSKAIHTQQTQLLDVLAYQVSS